MSIWILPLTSLKNIFSRYDKFILPELWILNSYNYRKSVYSYTLSLPQQLFTWSFKGEKKLKLTLISKGCKGGLSSFEKLEQFLVNQEIKVGPNHLFFLKSAFRVVSFWMISHFT